jgi:hypothetical protein
VAPQSEEIIVADMARSPSRTSKLFSQVAGTKSFGTAALRHGKYQPWSPFQSQAVF